MYARQPPFRGVRIPHNYSGNAFSSPSEEKTPSEESAEPSALEEAATNVSEASNPSAGESAKQASKEPSETVSAGKLLSSPFPFSLPSLGSSGEGGKLFGLLGTEELLILGLILLVAGNDSKDELIFLLILLLLIR